MSSSGSTDALAFSVDNTISYNHNDVHEISAPSMENIETESEIIPSANTLAFSDCSCATFDRNNLT